MREQHRWKRTETLRGKLLPTVPNDATKTGGSLDPPRPGMSSPCRVFGCAQQAAL